MEVAECLSRGTNPRTGRGATSEPAAVNRTRRTKRMLRFGCRLQQKLCVTGSKARCGEKPPWKSSSFFLSPPLYRQLLYLQLHQSAVECRETPGPDGSRMKGAEMKSPHLRNSATSSDVWRRSNASRQPGGSGRGGKRDRKAFTVHGTQRYHGSSGSKTIPLFVLKIHPILRLKDFIQTGVSPTGSARN